MTLKLPSPHWHGKSSLEEVMAKRRSIRKLTSGPLSWEQIGQLLWSSYGITEPKEGLRTTPSAGALYPLEIYVLTHESVYQYRPKTHELVHSSRPMSVRSCARPRSNRNAWTCQTQTPKPRGQQVVQNDRKSPPL